MEKRAGASTDISAKNPSLAIFPRHKLPSLSVEGPIEKTGGSGERWARQQARSRQQPFCADFFWIFLDIGLLCLCHEHSRRLQKHSQGTGGEIGAGKAPEKGGWGLLGLVVD